MASKKLINSLISYRVAVIFSEFFYKYFTFHRLIAKYIAMKMVKH